MGTSSSQGRENEFQELRLDAEIALKLPRSWRHNQEYDGRWSVKSGDCAASLFVERDLLFAGEEVPPEDMARRLGRKAEELLEFLGGQTGTLKLEEPPRKAGRLIHAIVDYQDHGTDMRSFRWYLLKEGPSAPELYRRVLTTTKAHAATPEISTIEGLITAQLRH